MRSAEFIVWQRATRACAEHVARDFESRCRRIERVLEVDLDRAVADDATFDDVLHRLESEAPRYLGVSKNPAGAVNVLQRAAKMYREFARQTAVNRPN